MTRRHTIIATLIFLILMLSVSAQATPIVGAFSLASGSNQSFVPVDGATGAIVSLGAATGIDFTTVIVGGVPQPTPGVAGAFTVNSATGDFLVLLGSVGSIKDFSFAGPGSANYPVVPIAAFETDGGLTVDLLSITLNFQSPTGLVLTGSGIFHLAGYDSTPGTFVFSANQSGRTFSFSASEDAVGVPEPASIYLAAMGAAAAFGLARFRKQN